MRTRARSAVYLELARLWRSPGTLVENWQPYRCRRLLRLLAAAGYTPLARAESARLETLAGAKTPAPPTAARVSPSPAQWEPVESLHSPWTADASAGLPFSHQPGYLMGDSGLHMLSILEDLHLAVPRDLIGRPDHLGLELEVMALLCQFAPLHTQRLFLTDRLAWLPRYYRNISDCGVCPEVLALAEFTMGYVAVERIALNHSLQEAQ